MSSICILHFYHKFLDKYFIAYENKILSKFLVICVITGCPKNGVLTVHYGIEETTVNVRKMFKKFYWT
jgi:hypothetical protein